MLTWQNTGDPCTPETLTFVDHLMPTRIGYTTAFGPNISAIYTSNPTITVAADTGYSPRGLCYLDSTGAQQFIFSLSKKLFRHPGNADISRGVAYTNGYFSFAQYREYIYACNGADLLQKSSTGAFADVASTPKLTRICAWGERLFGINNVASFTSGGTPYAASNYRYWISGIGNPEQFDAAIDSTAYTDDIKDDGGPLVACAVLRDFVVVLKKSGVYVIEDTGGPIFAEPKVSDYYGCEWPDSVIVVNNIMYWISPTRSGEVVAFDGTQITPVSNSLASTIIDRSSYYLNSQFINPAGSSVEIEGGITAATDGENIVWSRTTAAVGGIPNGVTTQQLYMNIPTGRFGYSSQYAKSNANTPYLPFGVYSNASQNAILTVASTQIATGANKFVASQMQPAYLTGAGTAELYRGAAQQNAINNFTVRFSEYVYRNDVDNYSAVKIKTALAAFPTAFSPNGLEALNPITPTLQWSSSQRSGDSLYKPESTSVTIPTGVWNSTTYSFNIPSGTARSRSASVFAFVISGLQPINSFTGVAIDYVPSGTKQAGAKAGTWQ